MAEEGRGVAEDLVLGPEPPLDEAGEPGEGEEGEEVGPEQVVRQAGALGEESNGLRLAERDVPLLLARRGLEQPDDVRGVHGVDERLEHGEHQALADRHLGRHVLGVVRAHRPGGEEADHGVGRPGRSSRAGRGSGGRPGRAPAPRSPDGRRRWRPRARGRRRASGRPGCRSPRRRGTDRRPSRGARGPAGSRNRASPKSKRSSSRLTRIGAFIETTGMHSNPGCPAGGSGIASVE